MKREKEAKSSKKKLPPKCPIIRFLGKRTFSNYEYVDKFERRGEPVNNKVFLYDISNKLVSTAIWGIYDDDYLIAKKENIASPLGYLGKSDVYLGCSMLLTKYDAFELLTRGTSTPGRFYPSTLMHLPTIEVCFKQPPLPVYWNFADPSERMLTGVDMDDCLAGLYLYVDPAGYNQGIDSRNGWVGTVYELSYDEGFKRPVLKDPSRFKFEWRTGWYFYIDFSFEDTLYLSGKRLYCRVGRKHTGGNILWSEIKSFVMCSSAKEGFSGCSLGGSALHTIPNSVCEINHLDDVEYLKKVNALVSRLKTVVNAIGVFNTYRFHETLDKGGKMGHLKELKISPDLSSVYMHIYLHNFQCLKQNPSTNLVNCGGNTNDLYKILTPVKDFSFLKGFENLRLDLSENDIPAMGGLELVLKELNKYCKPKGLKLELTRLEDISALKGISVEKLNISFNYDLKDISPLSGAPNLKMLNIEKVARREKIDLSPLASCPKLEVLKFSPEGCENISALKKIPTLKEINGESAEDFFKRNGL